MRTLFLALLALWGFASTADAQIIAIHFKDEKAAKKYKNHLVEFQGEMVVIGEPKRGIRWLPDKGQIQYDGQGGNQLFVINPKKPEDVAYYLVDGEKVEASKKNVVSITGPNIRKISVVMRDQSLPGLTTEYQIRKEETEDYRAQRDALEEGTVEWLAAHHRLVTTLERLELWLSKIGFNGPRKDVQKTIQKEKKEVEEAALAVRAQRAMDSIKAVEPPEEFAAASQELSGGKHVFRGFESEHLRIYYLADGHSEAQLLADSEVEGAMRLGETVIEGFRAQFVDPYRGEDYKDNIPDSVILTFVFFPPEQDLYAKYAGKIYSYRKSGNAENDNTRGTWLSGGFPQHLRNVWRTGQKDVAGEMQHQVDLSGIMCHGLGHALAGRHFGNGNIRVEQAWLVEATGNQISYEHLGRNNVNCFGMKKKPTYTKRKVAKPGEKTIAVGRRAVYNELALSQGSQIQQIALKDLVDLNDADLAKGWSFYDYVARKEGKQGQEWLRALGKFATNRNSLVEKWRAAAEEILDIKGRDPIKAVEERWREYAETEQETE